MNADRDVLYNKNLIKVLRRQLHFANVIGDVYFRGRRIQDVDVAVHHSMECKHILNIYKLKKDGSLVLCKKHDVVWNENN